MYKNIYGLKTYFNINNDLIKVMYNCIGIVNDTVQIHTCIVYLRTQKTTWPVTSIVMIL